jgi:hypothetical protein
MTDTLSLKLQGITARNKLSLNVRRNFVGVWTQAVAASH